jgi:hypothetical protein
MLPRPLVVILVVVGLVMLTRMASAPKGSELVKDKQVLAKLIVLLDSARSKMQSATQDNNALLALVHNTEALSLISALSTLVSPTDAETYLKTNLLALHTKALEQRRVLMANFRAACPNMAVADVYV